MALRIVITQKRLSTTNKLLGESIIRNGLLKVANLLKTLESSFNFKASVKGKRKVLQRKGILFIFVYKGSSFQLEYNDEMLKYDLFFRFP